MASPLQPVYNIAALCAAHGLTEVVLSPGSRCAPLTLAFARHPETHVRVVPDERAAAFIGLGIAQARRVPTVLVCTSGTAGLNYAPAVAEAYYQQVPLLVLTADRPPEWIDQLDGQTIRQNGLYGPHVKASYTFPTEFSHPDAKWHSERIINEAINLAKAYPPGPVHVNIPLREPLYPAAGEEVAFASLDPIVNQTPEFSLPFLASERRNLFILDESDEPTPDINEGTAESGQRSKNHKIKPLPRILVVVGQTASTDLKAYNLGRFSEAFAAPVIADTISNLPAELPNLITHHDVFLAGLSKESKEALAPDLLITCGLSLISKSLKLFLRDMTPKQHWHIQEAGPVADPFRRLSKVIRCPPDHFFGYWMLYRKPEEPAGILANWQSAEFRARNFLSRFFEQANGFTEFSAIHTALQRLSASTALHLANSMAVRYANILGVPAGVEVFANRGTSGIDGCTSTAVGYALARPDQQVVLLTGDVAFFYDRNAFWHNYPTPNLRVVLLNNHGGGIFRLIDGPRQQPEIDEFFETRQQLTAENLCRDFHLPYFPVDSMEKLDAALPVFFGPEGAGGVLEIQTDSKTNAAFFEQYRAAVKAAFS